VKLLQQALARLGYPVGAVDGVYGPSTEQAVVRFQRAAGLDADGILGPNTLRALAKAIRNAG
jgi:g-D-glutamyl-meso-diaminopimelate peptidase